MGKRIRDYVKYTKLELENYTKLPGACVQKINKNIHINFPPYGLGSMKKTLLYIISEKKIGFYDNELKGIILDMRNIKLLGNLAALRFDDPTLHIDIQADCYVFKPKIGSIVRGLVKHIAAHQISVIIYRVFNVSIRLSATERYDNTNIELNSEIEFRIKNFDLESLMPYIEGELAAREMPLKSLEPKHIYLNISDSESNTTENDEETKRQPIKIPRKRKKSIILPEQENSDDEEIVFSEIFHLKPEDVKNIKDGTNKANKIEFSDNFDLKIDEIKEIEDKNCNKRKKLVKRNTLSKDDNKKIKQSSSTEDDSEQEPKDTNKTRKNLSKTSELNDDKIKKLPNNGNIISNKLTNSSSSDDETDYNKFSLIGKTSNKTILKNEIKSAQSSSDDEISFQKITPEKEKKLGNMRKSKKIDIPQREVISSSEYEIENIVTSTTNSKKATKIHERKISTSDNSVSESSSPNKEIKKEFTIKSEYLADAEEHYESEDILQDIPQREGISSNENGIENIVTSTINSKKATKKNERKISILDNEDLYVSQKNLNDNFAVSEISSPTKKIKKEITIKSEYVANAEENYESEDIFDILTLESPLRQQKRMHNTISANKISNVDSKSDNYSNFNIKIEPPSPKKKQKQNSLEENVNNIKSEVTEEYNELMNCSQSTIKKKNKKLNESCTENTAMPVVGLKKPESGRNRNLSISFTSSVLHDSMLDIINRTLSKKIESPKKDINSKTSLKNVNSKVELEIKGKSGLVDSMTQIVERALSKKIKSSPQTKSVVNNKKNESDKLLTKVTPTESNSVNEDVNSIIKKVLKNKTNSNKKKKTVSESSSNIDDKSSIISEKKSVNEAMDSIMARILSGKMESPKKVATSDALSVVKQKIKKQTRKSTDSILSNKNQSSKKNVSIDETLNINIPSVNEFISITENNNNKNKKRKLSSGSNDSNQINKKPRKSVTFNSNAVIENEVDNNDNDVSLNGYSFSVPPLSSTKIESVKKSKKGF